MIGHRPSIRVLADRQLDVDTLVAFDDTASGAHVSLYLPTHPAGRDVVQDPIRFRRLVGSAAAELDDDALIRQLHDLGNDGDFWAHGSAGLAVLADATQATAIRLAEPPVELAVVSDRYHLKPLLRSLALAVEFDVLALSQHAIRLVRSSATGVAVVDVPDLPPSMLEALRWDDRERQLTSHAAGRAGAARVTAAFHGQGDSGDARDGDIERFLRLVDRAIVHERGASRVPLVLAGVDELVAAYRAVTRCREVADGHVAGNPDRQREHELAAAARPLVEPASIDRQRRARETFLAGASATVATIEQAVIAAAAGQIASVFVPADVEHWGRFTPGQALLREHEAREPLDHDLGDVAAIETLRHGGEAFVVPATEIPGSGTAAATLHY